MHSLLSYAKKLSRTTGLLSALALALSGVGWGQILTFDFSGLAGSEASASSNFNNAGLTSSTISRGAGLTASGNADRFNSTNWALTSIANAVTGNNHVEFTITPNAGKQFSISSIVVQWQRSGTGNTQIALRSSIDGYTTNLDAVKIVTDNTTTQTFTWTFTQANRSTAVTYRFYSYAEGTAGTGGPGDGTGNDIIVNGTVSDFGPTITGAATASAFTTTYGTVSAAQTFSISGSNLTANLVATAPTGFEVSADGTTYGSTATFAQTSGSASGSLRIRLAATAPVTGTYNTQNIVLSSTGATSANIATAASGNAVTAKNLTITGLTALDKNWDDTATVTVNGTPEYVGLVNSETFSVTGSVTWAFADAAVGTGKTLVRSGNYATPSTNYTVTQPTLSASIFAVVPTAPAITGITPGNEQLSIAFTPSASSGGISIINYEFSTDDGSTWTTPSPAVTSSPLLITGLTNGTPYAVKVRAVNAIGSGAASAAVSGTPVAPSMPTIEVTPATFASALSTTYGTPSSALSFTASGSLLSGNLTVTAPTGLEVSLAAESGYAASLVLTETSGTVSPTTIYARLKATAPATTYNNSSITVSGGGASTQSVSTTASGNAVTPKALTITGLSAESKIYDATTTATINGTAAYLGLANDEVHAVTDSVTWTFPNPNTGIAKVLTRSADFTAPNANYTLSAQPTLSADISAKELTGTFTADNKVYDATTVATVLTRNVVGKIGSEDVNHTGGTATFADADVADGKTVTLTGASLTGTDAGNYILGSVTPTTADITQGAALIAFPSLPSGKKVGDAPFASGASSNFGTMAYSSSNNTVATIDSSTGLITVLAPGVTTITATIAGTTNYTGDSESQTLQVVGLPGSASTIFTENMGTPSGTVAIASHTFQNSTSSLTYSNGGQTNSADIRNTNTSSGYSGSSGSGNVFFTSTSGAYGFAIENINAASYSNLQLSYAYRKESASALASFSVDYWNGSAWVTLANTSSALFSEAANAATGWYPALSLSLPNAAQINGLKIRFVKTGGLSIRIDDVRLTGALPSPTLTPSGSFSALSTTYGTASAASSTTAVVTGGSLTANIVATAPAGFQVSADGSTWDATATFAQTGGFADGILHLRLAATAPAGAYTGQVVTLSSSGAANRTIAITNSTVLTKTLTLSSAAVPDKVYDATPAATITGTLDGIVNEDEVTLVGTGVYDSPSVGTDIPVTSSATLGGADAGNYQLIQPTGLTADITAKELTITGATAVNRIVNATSTVAISGGTLVGVESGDTVILGGSPIGTMADATIGTAKPVTVSGFSISGASSTNYSLTQPTGLTVDILESTPFNVWAVANNATGGKTGDPDADTYNNLMEYAFGTNPTTSSAGPIIFAEGMVTTPGQPVLQIEAGVYYAVFGRRVDYATAGLTYTVQFSAGMEGWFSSATVPAVIATDGTIDAVRIRFPNFVSTPSGPKKPTFFRVQISD